MEALKLTAYSLSLMEVRQSFRLLETICYMPYAISKGMAFRFEHLTIWKDAVNYAKTIYTLTRKFPKDELFALTSQLRRAVSSISTNIAEGSGSSSKKDFVHFLDIAIKSAFETVSLLYLAKEQGYVTEKERLVLYEQAEILVKKIQSFKRSLL